LADPAHGPLFEEERPMPLQVFITRDVDHLSEVATGVVRDRVCRKIAAASAWQISARAAERRLAELGFARNPACGRMK